MSANRLKHKPRDRTEAPTDRTDKSGARLLSIRLVLPRPLNLIPNPGLENQKENSRYLHGQQHH
jgi:hypothetical protein